MQRHLLRIVAAGILSGALAACATTTTGSTAAGPAAGPAQAAAVAGRTAGLPGKPACFWARNFQGSWTVLSQTELIVYAPLTADPYLIKLLEPVVNLPFDLRLGFEDVEHTGQICNDTADDLLVPDYTPHRIPIVAVRQLTPLEQAQLLRAHGLKVPRNLQNLKG
ncbi:MAG TPA: DUF6491 family protein [Steroidobacteraceae bacterium]|nr:DUF6491 family protein [Steroidobacteraceae bacterium]